MIVITRINKDFCSDTFMPEYDSKKFTCIYQSAAERFEEDFTYDYCFYINRDMLGKHFEFLPNEILQEYIENPEVTFMH